MTYQPAWKKKRAEDAKRLAEWREAKPIDPERALAEARAQDAAIRKDFKGLLERHPEHPNVPMWRAVLDRGWWGRSEWREASQRTAVLLDRRRAGAATQGELF